MACQFHNILVMITLIMIILLAISIISWETQVPKNKMDMYKEIFAALDTDSSGSLSLSELRFAFQVPA